MNEKQRRTENETLVLFRLFVVVVVQYHAIKAEIDLELPPFGFGGPK